MLFIHLIRLRSSPRPESTRYFSKQAICFDTFQKKLLFFTAIFADFYKNDINQQVILIFNSRASATYKIQCGIRTQISRMYHSYSEETLLDQCSTTSAKNNKSRARGLINVMYFFRQQWYFWSGFPNCVNQCELVTNLIKKNGYCVCKFTIFFIDRRQWPGCKRNIDWAN